MLKTFYFMVLLFVVIVAGAWSEPTKLLDEPDIFGKEVVFTYAGDIWSANIETGQTIQITSYPGRESSPHFSPDGKWIAFTGNYDGNQDVYLIPAKGGEPKRLTFHGARDIAIGWTPDGTSVIFESNREVGYYGPYVYQVKMDGGYPQRIAIDRAAWAKYNSDGTKIVFNRRPGEFRNWKRYHGGEAPDVWLADLKMHTFKNLTSDYTGVDLRPLWVGDDVYFVSDRKTNINNLWQYNTKTGEFTQKTFFSDFAVYAPETDGKSVVFRYAGAIYLYDIASGKARDLNLSLPAENWQGRPAYVNPTEYLAGFDVAPDGKSAVVDARGDLYKIDEKHGKWENLTHSQGVREQYPVISPDGNQIAYFSDKTGNYQLYVQSLAPAAEPVQLTDNLVTYPYHLVWSSDGSKLVFGDKDYIIRMVDVASGKVKEIDHGHYQKDYEFYWEISEYDWSPDSKWIVFSKVQPNLNSAIYLYSLDQDKVFPLTTGELDDYEPVFDKSGDYLYFISNRHFNPQIDASEDNFIIGKMSQLCAVQLRAGEKPPFEKDQTDDNQEEKSESAFRIDLSGIHNRIYTVPVPPGYFKKLHAGKNQVFVMGKAQYGFPGIEEFFNPGSVQDYFVKAYDMKAQKEVDLLDGIGAFQVNSSGTALAYRSGDTVGILDLEDLAPHSIGDGKLDFSRVEMLLDRHAEWTQIFNEVWRWYRDFFYDPQMHGIDWQKIHDAYLPMVKDVQTRDDLNEWLSEMVGELCASHMYIFGGDENNGFDQPRVSTGLLGADISPDQQNGLFRFQKIYLGKSWDNAFRGPLAMPNVQVKAGEYLLAIDGHTIAPGENYLRYLVNKANKKIDITVSETPDGKHSRIYEVEPVSSERNLRQWEWVRSREDIVDKAGNGEIGYMHLDDMDQEGLGQFEQGWKANKYKKGLIIDVRYNGGGFTNYFIIDKLERKLVFGTKTREFSPMRFPMAVTTAKMAALINEYTGSDGELFTVHFQARQFGKAIGTRTWGGLIGIINVIPTVDNGIAVQPNVGFYDFQGKWVVENHGAVPDTGYAVEILPEQGLKGEDPQLKKAIEEVKAQIKGEGAALPAPPPFPIKKP